MATIEIYSRYVSLGPLNSVLITAGEKPFEHLYIVYTDDNGNKRIIRGGPEANGLISDSEGPVTGNLNVIEGGYTSDSKDWDNPEDDEGGDRYVHEKQVIASGS